MSEETRCSICEKVYDDNVEHIGKDVPAAHGPIERHFFTAQTKSMPVVNLEALLDVRNNKINALQARVDTLTKGLEETKETLTITESQFRHTKTREMALREAISEMIEDADDGNTSRVCRTGASALALTPAPASETEGFNPNRIDSAWDRIPEGAATRETPTPSPASETEPLAAPLGRMADWAKERGLSTEEWKEFLFTGNLPTNEPPETGTVCPCVKAREVLDEDMCIPCWEASYSRRPHLNCITEGCVDGRIPQEGTTITVEGEADDS